MVLGQSRFDIFRSCDASRGRSVMGSDKHDGELQANGAIRLRRDREDACRGGGA